MKKYLKLISRVLSLFVISMVMSQGSYTKVNAEEITNQTTIINDATMGDGINQFKYSGKWGTSTGYSQFYNGDEHWSNALNWGGSPENIYYTVKFEGTKIEVYGNKQPGLGIYAVSVDGGTEVEVDAYSATNKYQQLIYTSPELVNGVHTLKVRATGKKTGSAPDMQVDFAKVYHGEIASEEVQLSSNDITIETGMIHSLIATVLPENASNKEVVWESADESIATVLNGNVVGKSVGTTKIKATVKNTDISAECAVTVTKAGNVIGASVGSPDRHYLQKDYEEVSRMAKASWSGIGWKGDVLNSEIVLWTKGSDVNNVKVSASNFVDEQGNSIDSSNVDVTFLKYVSAHVGRGFSWGNIPGANVPREMVPDILYGSEPMNIEKEKVQPAWVNINIPRDAKAGTYNGTLKVEADGLEEAIELKYSFEVLDATQPLATENEFHLELWQYPYTFARYYEVEPFTDEFFEMITPQMEAYRDAGGKAITTTIVEDPWNQQTYDKYPSMVKWTKKADGTFEYDFDHFDKWVQFNLDLGITKQITAFSMIPWDNRIMYFDEVQNKIVQEKPSPGSARWNELWNDFIDEFVVHLDEKGWFEKTYIAMDERPINTMIPVLDLLESKPNKDGKTLKVSGAMNYKSLDRSILDRIADISINLGHINANNEDVRELSAHRDELGLNTTMYTCVGDYPSSFTRSNPSESAWTIWYSASQNTNGYLRWAFDAWVEEPLESVDHWYWESGDPFFLYPGDKGDEVPTPRSTPRFERLKEGIRDVEKINYIQRNTSELDEEIDTMLRSIQRAYGKQNAWGANEAGSEANKNLIDSEVNRLRAELMEITRQYIEIRDAEVNVSVESVELNKSELELNVGTEESLVATVLPENATNKNVTWTSSNEAVATVENGKVVAIAEGTATITVTTADGNKTSVATLTVVNPITTVGSVTINSNEEVILGNDLEMKLGVNEINESLNYYSTDFTLTYNPEEFDFKSVTSLNDDLYVTGSKVKDGEIRIIAASLGKTMKNDANLIKVNLTSKKEATSTIEVTKAEIADENGKVETLELATKTVKIVKENEEIVVGKVKNLEATATKNEATLSWNAPSSTTGIVGYIIYKDGKELEEVPVGTTTYTATKLRSNTNYGFKVATKYSNGEVSKPVSENIRTKK